ncbi:MAG: hypothetical protein LCH43_00375 [Actinobacteria bacterium]|nr:hypothetical protein [Actinomycetota bacterium]
MDADLAALLSSAVEQLRAADVADEALAELRPARRIGPITKPMRFVPAGRAWRLGEILLDTDARLYSTGSVTRALTPKDFAANKSQAEEDRRELQRAAVRGRFATGEAVNFGYAPLEPGDDRLQLVDGTPTLRLQHAEVPLETYLADRIRFAINPGWD